MIYSNEQNGSPVLMATPDHSKMVTLNPGDFRFCLPAIGKPPLRLYTLLGSCVSVILWHPAHRSGGMSHSLLPIRPARDAAKAFDGRYCEDAIALFRQELARINMPAQQYRVYIVGGANMFGTTNGTLLIGNRNVEVARLCLREAGFHIRAEHVLGDKYRKVVLDMNTGNVELTVNQQKIVL